MGKVFIFVGRSASGKTSLQNWISKKMNGPIHVSYTTRAIREKEVDGVDYHFVSLEQFNAIEMLEKAEFAGNFYGTPKGDFETFLNNNKVSFLITEQSGARLFKKLYGEQVVTILLDMEPVVSKELLLRRDGVEKGTSRFLHDESLDWSGDGFDWVIKENGKNWKEVRQKVLDVVQSSIG